ncbi:MAG TPA: hypothetical protein PLV17_08940 [Spirochaetota bacterium]|nr:hypothetical protein [Spirochaetota bacterium]
MKLINENTYLFIEVKQMNNMRTTALIEEDCLKLLYRIAAVRKMKISKIIELIFRDIISREYPKIRIRNNSTVKYQSNCENMIVLHYSVPSEIYEACLDLRKYGKMSVSRILNEGIMLLYNMLNGTAVGQNLKEKLISEFMTKLDNYVLNYSIIRKKTKQRGLVTTEIHVQIT